jgi:hypothetical protein
VLAGCALNAYEHVISKEFRTETVNRTDVNWEKFYHGIAIEMPHQQANIKDVIYAHLERANKDDTQDLFKTKERFDNICRHAHTLPGQEPKPNEAKKLTLFYGLFHKSYRNKFTTVPRQVTDNSKSLNTIAKFMHSIWKTECTTGIRANRKDLKHKAES